MTRDLRNRLGAAYVAALDAQHGPSASTVQVAIGSDVLASLEAMPTRPTGVATDKLWGFPMILDKDAAPDSITIRSIVTIA